MIEERRLVEKILRLVAQICWENQLYNYFGEFNRQIYDTELFVFATLQEFTQLQYALKVENKKITKMKIVPER